MGPPELELAKARAEGERLEDALFLLILLGWSIQLLASFVTIWCRDFAQ
jgi:hypothetical protein